ncbi:MAG: hypothetical protein IJ354_09245 [Clostridia bacterium]|nr:hypothetical protein [Clostridia bacterium]
MKNMLRKAQFVLMLTLMAVPLSFIVGVNAIEDRLWMLAAFAALYAMPAWLCMQIRGRIRLVAGVLTAMAILAFGIVLLPWREAWWTLVIPLGYAVLLFYTLPMSSWQQDQELPYHMHLIGAGVYVVVQLAIMFKPQRFAPVQTAFLLCFLAFGALTMLALNRRSLLDAAPRGRRAPAAMRHKNHVFTVGMMLLVLIISAIPALSRALAWAWKQLIQAIAAVLKLIASLLPAAQTGGGGGGGEPGMLGGLPAEEPSLFAKIMERVFIILAVLVVAAALVLALRVLWRKLRVLVHRLWTMLNRYALAASEDYVDEVTDTRVSDDRTSRRRLFDDWFAHVNEEKLSPVERVRYRYRRLLRRHAEWLPGSTARENLPQQAAQLYEKARYSGEDVTAEEAETFVRQAKALEKKG